MFIKKIKLLIITMLRGEYNSVRYRFLILPKERLFYLFFRIKGNSWINYYSKRLDGYAKNNKRIVNIENYFKSNKKTFNYLKEIGLKPNDKFLDFGCGVFRLGIILIPYLQKGNYTGIDISQERIKIGLNNLKKTGIDLKAFNYIVNKNNNIDRLINEKFDYIYMESVVTHMPKDDFERLILSFTSILKPDGLLLFTFLKGNSYRVKGMKDFFYPIDLIKKITKKAGFEFEIDTDWEDDKIPMAKLSLIN